MAFIFLALAASDRSKAEIIIAQPVCNIIEDVSSVIVQGQPMEYFGKEGRGEDSSNFRMRIVQQELTSPLPRP